jgi:hypothetical protein
MTEPAQPTQIPAFDPGNPYAIAGEYPAMMSTTTVQTPIGQRCLLTIRAAGATLTLMLDRDTAKAWAAQLDGAASPMSGLLIASPGAIPPPPNGQPR